MKSGFLKHHIPRPLRRFLKRSFTRAWTWYHRKDIFRWGNELESILTSSPTNMDPILFLPTVSWHIHLFQRPQQLALAFARKGRLVFYGEVAYRSDSPLGFRQWIPGLYIARVPMEVFAYKLSCPILYVLAYNAGYLDLFPNRRILYEYIDELEVFTDYYLPELRFQHARLLKEADVVSITAKNLWQEAQASRPDALYLPNAVDYDFFTARLAEVTSPPEDLQPILMKNTPIVGYYGALAHWFDYGLLFSVAERLPEWQFVLIGPDYDGTLPRTRMASKPNITWLGPKPYPNIPCYARFMDVLIIPFHLNPITHATSPLKLFEYMCAGKPIVVTPMKEASSYPGVLSADTPDNFVSQLQKAWDLRNDSEYRAILEETARANTWDARADALLASLEDSR